MILSVLIPTTPDRRPQTFKLVKELISQFKRTCLGPKSKEMLVVSYINPPKGVNAVFDHLKIGELEIITCEDNKEMSVGTKRDYLYKAATGKFSVQWDSDDWISKDGLYRIWAALIQNMDTDCVTYREKCLVNGKYLKSNHSLKYADWEGDGTKIFPDGYHYHRTPFFKSVIRTDYCQHIGVADMRYAEDIDFSRLIKPMLVDEVHIDAEIYEYIHESTPHNERYGIKP